MLDIFKPINYNKITERTNVRLEEIMETRFVFQTLFDIDAVGNDLEFFSGTCGKNGQSVTVAMGGPTIRVKKLTIN